MKLAVPVQVALLKAIASVLDGGRLRLYTGTNAPLVEIRLARPAATVTADGMLTVHPDGPDRASRTGQPERFACIDSHGAVVFSGSVGHKNDPGDYDIRIDRRVIEVGDIVQLHDVVVRW